MKIVVAAAGLMLAVAARGAVLAQSSTDAPTAAALSGAEAWKSLLGNTITGTTADGPYSEYYEADGTAIHVDGDGREQGQWSLKDVAVCFSFPTDPDEQRECRTVEVAGTHGAFIAGDGSRYAFEILPGNPKHL